MVVQSLPVGTAIIAGYNFNCFCLGRIKQKRIFEHAHIQIILRMRKISSGSLVSIDTVL